MKTLYHHNPELAREIFENLGKQERVRCSLDELAREGARLLLETMMQLEVEEFLGRARYERNADRVAGAYRNGSRRRSLKIPQGDLLLDYPKVAGAGRSFRSKAFPAYQRKSDALSQLLPLCYAEGLSTRDFRRALKPLMGETGLSRSSISRANRLLYEAYANWRKRDLSTLDLLYLFLDGVSQKVRIGQKGSDTILVAHGITATGERALVGLALGPRESADSWQALVEDFQDRGLRAPMLVISDGGQGLIKAVETVWPEIPRQRCIAHKIRNVLNRVPKKRQAEVKRALGRIFHATGLAEAQKAARDFVRRYQHDLTTAAEVFLDDFDACLTFYRFPEVHWKRIRTSNVIERAFREVRRRTDVIGRFPNERSALVVVFATLEQDRLNWRGIRVNPAILAQVRAGSEDCRKSPLQLNLLKEFVA